MAHDPISDLKRYAAALEAQVSGERSRHAARTALHASGPRRAPRRTVVAIAATLLMGVSNVALATIADPAVPGDALYGVDRAYERVGALFGSDSTHAGERATEVMALQAQGKSAEALALVQETLTTLVQSDDPEAAVEEFTAGLGSTTSFREQVNAILQVAKTTDVSGPEVSKAARDIALQIVQGLDLPDSAQGTPGRPADPGPPDDKGPGSPPTPPTPPVNPGQGNPGNQGQKGGPP